MEIKTPTVDELKKTYNNLAFIHQKLMASTFYPEDFAQADVAIKFLTEMANTLSDEIQKLETAAKEAGSENVETKE